MLDRRHRLTSSAGFTRATRRGRRSGTRTLVAHVCDERVPAGVVDEAPLGGSPRVGFVVGKAVGSAVVRNRVRRRLRHLVRDRVGSWSGAPLVVVRALPAAAGASFDELARDLDATLRRAGLETPDPTGTITSPRSLR